MEEEAKRRIAEQTDEEEERLRNTRIEDVVETEHLVPVLLSRLRTVRALDSHGGGIAVASMGTLPMDLISFSIDRCLPFAVFDQDFGRRS